MSDKMAMPGMISGEGEERFIHEENEPPMGTNPGEGGTSVKGAHSFYSPDLNAVGVWEYGRGQDGVVMRPERRTFRVPAEKPSKRLVRPCWRVEREYARSRR
jgi:hypothetical protein